DEPAAESDVKRWLRDTKSLRADFIQQGADGSFLRGTFTMRQPGRIRFDYKDASDLLIVADGKAVYFIDYEVRQLSRYPLKETPLAPLLDSAAIETLALNVTEVTEGPMAGTIAVTSKDPKHREYGTLTMMFDRVDAAGSKLLLQAWTVLDAQGNLTQVTLRDQEENIAVADSTFTFKDPRRRRPGSRTR
ncbi:MAG: outer membrane lipoprotein carrier protein LolA, partial [Pseudomonadota bacterium]